MKRVLLFLVIASICGGCQKGNSSGVLHENLGGSYFSRSFIQVFCEVEGLSVCRVDDVSFNVIMNGSSFTSQDGALYDRYCEKYGDISFDCYIDYPSTAVVNDFQRVNIYINGVCVNSSVMMKFTSSKLFVESGYKKPEGAMINENLVGTSALEHINKRVAEITESDLRLMDPVFLLIFSTPIEKGSQLSVEMKSADGTIRGVLP